MIAKYVYWGKVEQILINSIQIVNRLFPSNYFPHKYNRVSLCE